ncbi:MAG TPA: bifunctional DNA primase/polymerase, partial [Parvularculaceae bacterium]|nr:bifunctional DNA primase/polymerase [Parvularculaceae bacterium]
RGAVLMSVRPNNAMLHAALWYAELGYPIFPCAPGRKTPLIEHGLLEATTDAERITAWWTQHPSANIAIRTDGPMAPEIDLTKARPAQDVHEKLVAEEMSKIEREKKGAEEPAEVAA